MDRHPYEKESHASHAKWAIRGRQSQGHFRLNAKEVLVNFVLSSTWGHAQKLKDMLRSTACTMTCNALSLHCASAVISIRGTLSADDLITDFMCEPADMDDWMSTATTPHAGQGQGSHDPHLSVGSSAGTGFFSRRSSSTQQPAGETPSPALHSGGTCFYHAGQGQRNPELHQTGASGDSTGFCTKQSSS